jgi:hypothetical protein
MERVIYPVMLMAKQTLYQNQRTRKDGATVHSSLTGRFFKTADVRVDYPRNFSVHAVLTKTPLRRERIEAVATVSGATAANGAVVVGGIARTKWPRDGDGYHDLVHEIAIPQIPGKKINGQAVRRAIMRTVIELIETYLEFETHRE